MRKSIVCLFFLSLIAVDFHAQCAMCRAVLESEAGQETAKGVNNGIMWLMAFPYILVALVGYAIYRMFKKKS